MEETWKKQSDKDLDLQQFNRMEKLLAGDRVPCSQSRVGNGEIWELDTKSNEWNLIWKKSDEDVS
tara:strand:- start:393 stop:587 length:195 start_codon:yes stop_codon:yes gene_type:complete